MNNGDIHIIRIAAEALLGFACVAFGLFIGEFIFGRQREGNEQKEVKELQKQQEDSTKTDLTESNKPAIRIDLKVDTADFTQMKHEQLSAINQMMEMIDKLRSHETKGKEPKSE
jgi:uncharacterized protein HemX